VEGKRKGRWVDDDPGDAERTAAPDSPSSAEDGELPSAAAPAKRARHEPIVWRSGSQPGAEDDGCRGAVRDRDGGRERGSGRDRSRRDGDKERGTERGRERDDSADASRGGSPSLGAAAARDTSAVPSPGAELQGLRAAALRRQEGAGSSGALDRAMERRGRGALCAPASPQPPRSASPPSRPGSATGGRAFAQASPALPRPGSSLGRLAGPAEAAAGQLRSAAEIAAAELADFQAAMEGDLDFDPTAPAAMKASPSGSEGSAMRDQSAHCKSRCSFSIRGALLPFVALLHSPAVMQSILSVSLLRQALPDASTRGRVRRCQFYDDNVTSILGIVKAVPLSVQHLRADEEPAPEAVLQASAPRPDVAAAAAAAPRGDDDAASEASLEDGHGHGKSRWHEEEIASDKAGVRAEHRENVIRYMATDWAMHQHDLEPATLQVRRMQWQLRGLAA